LDQFLDNFTHMSSTSNSVKDEMIPTIHEYAHKVSQESWNWWPPSHPYSSPSEQATTYRNRSKHRRRLKLLYRYNYCTDYNYCTTKVSCTEKKYFTFRKYVLSKFCYEKRLQDISDILFSGCM